MFCCPARATDLINSKARLDFNNAQHIHKTLDIANTYYIHVEHKLK